MDRTQQASTEVRSAPAEDGRAAFLRHHARLLRLCTLLAGTTDRGEDLAQETFVRALTKVVPLPPEEQYAYLRATASNLWKNRLRRLAIEHRWRPSDVATESPSAEERDALWRAVVALPVRQRACVVLRYYEGLSEQETAEVLRCSVGTVKSQTSRAIARLREGLSDEDRG